MSRIAVKRTLCAGIFLILALSVIPSAGAVTLVVGSQITSNNTQASIDPSLMYYSRNNTVWAFYSIQGQNGNFDIFYRIMSPNCLQSACLLIFYPQHRLTTGPGNNEFDSAAETLDGNVWVFFGSDRAGSFGIYYKTFNGTAWSADSRFTTWAGLDTHPSVLATSFGDLWVAWASAVACLPGCAANIALRIFNGTDWSPIQNVTSYGQDFEPSLSQAMDGTVWLAWARTAGSKGQHDIFFTTLDFSGVPGPEVQLTTDASDDSWPSIVNVANSPVAAVVWASNRNKVFDQSANKTVPEYDLFMKYSLNAGVSWSADTQVYYNPVTNPPRAVDNTKPSALQYSKGRIGIVWVSDLTGSDNIFSMTIQMADVGAKALVPFQTVIGRGRTVKVNVTLTNYGWEPEVATVTLTANGTQAGSPVQTSIPYQGTGIASFLWNTTGLPLGRYILTATEANLTGESNPSNNIITTTVTVTIPGDVNGDRVVNIVDLVAVALAFTCRVGSACYNPNTDTNQDGVVNILDLTYVAARLGSSG